MYTSTSKRAWRFSPHAVERLAKRMKLLMDMSVEAAISNTLNSDQAKLVVANYGRVVYEIPIFGVQTIAVCDEKERIVVTFMDAKKWHRRKINCRQTRHRNFRPKSSKAPVDEEE